MPVRRPILMACLLVVAAGLCGCQRTLFRQNMARTQYERYDRIRNRFTPLEEPDVFGNPQPALRARLTQP